MSAPSRDVAAGSATPVIALVGSVGGVEAVAATLERLPDDLAAAVVVLIHQEPDRAESVLSDVLARRSALPVEVAVDGHAVRAGAVAVIPPGTHALVTRDRRLSVIVSGVFPPHRPSADLLLTSMATALGSDAVVVVLTGRGHDGATGATAVHAHGGVLLATDEATSEVFSMPDATIRRDHAIDAVVDLAGLPGELVARVDARRRIATNARARPVRPDRPTLAERDVADALSLLYKQHLGRGPTRAKTSIVRDTVVCVVEGLDVPLERTLLEADVAETSEIVDRARLRVQRHLSGRMIDAVEDATGRRVRCHVPGANVEAGAATEVFLLAPEDEPVAPDRQSSAADGGGPGG